MSATPIDRTPPPGDLYRQPDGLRAVCLGAAARDVLIARARARVGQG